jgi:hypothetical protein
MSDEILRSSLLKGTLSIKVSDTDIRRSNTGAVTTITGSAIETDYILKIEPTNHVKFSQSSRGKLSQSSAIVDELKTYYCSKRYVDMRHLAKSMQDHAEDVVKFYANKSTGGRSGSSGDLRLLKNVKDTLQFITNTESKSSNIVGDLDSALKKKSSEQNITSSNRRPSSMLNEGAPMFVRMVLEGVDDFYEAIYSEKRQFGGKKTNIDHVKKTAERRTGIINSAFGKFLDALANADLDQVVKLQSDKVPKSLTGLIKSMEKFLLTDVVEDDNNPVHKNASSESLSSTEDYEKVEKDKAQDAAAPPSRGMVKAMSTRHRLSSIDREEEERECARVADLVMVESVEYKDAPALTSSLKGGKKKKFVPTAPPPKEGLLPDDPIEFGIIVAVGAVFFKLIQGRSMDIQLDVLAMFGFACGMIGYQFSAKADCVEIVSTYEPKKSVSITEPEPMTMAQRRSMLAGTAAPSRRSMMVIQKSLRSIRMSITGEKDDEPNKEVVPLKTFEMFPTGAKIGSHFNCWSSPSSSNFHVRGPNYLTDKKKIPSGDFLFPTRGCDLFLTDNPPTNIGRYDGILNGKLREKPTFIINYRLPWGVFISYHEIPEKFLPFLRKKHGHSSSTVPLPSTEGWTAGEKAMGNFLLSDTEEKNEVWKMVPVVVEGPWVVKKVVGGKPAIVGQKLPITYVYQPPDEKKGLCEYLEADLDIVSSAAARNILAVVRSYTQVLTIDLGFVVQANTAQYLPEQMMLGLRLHGLDPLTAELLPESDHDSILPELDDEDTD